MPANICRSRGRADPRRRRPRARSRSRPATSPRASCSPTWCPTPSIDKARDQVEQHEAPSEQATIRIPFTPQPDKNKFVKTSIDLLASLSPGKNYILLLVLDQAAAFDAQPVSSRRG